jgi:hypothetical protein
MLVGGSPALVLPAIVGRALFLGLLRTTHPKSVRMAALEAAILF